MPAALLAVAVGCAAQAPADPPVSLSVRLEVPPSLRAEVAARALTVHGEGASCAGADVSGGVPLDGLRDVALRPGEPVTLRVSPGRRAFHVLASDASGGPVARACAEETLAAGGTYTIALTLSAFCMDGAVESCATACGSTGARTCAGDRTWGPCVPPMEICNGRDDDCDGQCDDGFGCCAGAGSACSPAGGGAGVKTCDGACNQGALCVPMGQCSADGFCWLHPMPQGHTLHAVWAAAPDAAWAVGERGTILHWDGTAWTAEASGTTRDLRGVWSWGAGDVWAVGEGGTILRRQGGPWAPEPSGIGATLHAVWGAGPADVWAVGVAGTILAWDGSRWSSQASGTPADLHAVSGSDSTDVYAAGAGGVIRQFDGSGWGSRPTPTASDLFALWTDGFVLWVGGAGGIWDDEFGWIRESTVGGVRSLWGTPGGAVHAAYDSGIVRRWDGASFTENFTASLPGTALRGLGGTSAVDVWVVGDGGALVHRDGGVWSEQTTALTRSDLADAWGFTAGDVWVAGAEGIPLHWTDPGWSPGAPGAAVSALAGSSPANAWGAGANTGFGSEVGHVLRRAGATWEYVRAPVSPAVPLPADMNGIWTSSPTDVWIVGPGGIILHWNGLAYEGYPSSTASDLLAAWGAAPDDVWAVGAAGTIVHWDGARWSASPSPTTATLAEVRGSDADHVWAVGTAGTVVFFDGALWADRSIPAAPDLRSVWGAGGDDAWAVGAAGAVYHREGGAWVAKASGAARDLVGVWGFGSGDVWIVGAGATVLRRVP